MSDNGELEAVIAARHPEFNTEDCAVLAKKFGDALKKLADEKRIVAEITIIVQGGHHAPLGRKLRELRDKAGLDGAAVKRELDWSPTKLSRIETGQVPIKRNDLKIAREVYGADAATTEAMFKLWRETDS